MHIDEKISSLSIYIQQIEDSIRKTKKKKIVFLTFFILIFITMFIAILLAILLVWIPSFISIGLVLILTFLICSIGGVFSGCGKVWARIWAKISQKYELAKLNSRLTKKKNEIRDLKTLKSKYETVHKRILKLINDTEQLVIKGNYSNAMKNYEKAIKILKPYLEPYLDPYLELEKLVKLKKQELETTIHNEKIQLLPTLLKEGDTLRNQNKFEKAMKKYLECLKITNEEDFPEKEKLIPKIYSKINDIYLSQIDLFVKEINPSQYDGSIKILKSSLEISQKMYPSLEKGNIQQELKEKLDLLYTERIIKIIEQGNLERNLMKFDKSISTFKSALEITNSIYSYKERKRYKREIGDLISQTQIAKIKNAILNLGTRFDRLHISEIAEKCGESEINILKVAKDMIQRKEIYAEYFSSTQSVVFDKKANIIEIDALMDHFKKWEESPKIK